MFSVAWYFLRHDEQLEDLHASFGMVFTTFFEKINPITIQLKKYIIVCLELLNNLTFVYNDQRSNNILL